MTTTPDHHNRTTKSARCAFRLDAPLAVQQCGNEAQKRPAWTPAREFLVFNAAQGTDEGWIRLPLVTTTTAGSPR